MSKNFWSIFLLIGFIITLSCGTTFASEKRAEMKLTGPASVVAGGEFTVNVKIKLLGTTLDDAVTGIAAVLLYSPDVVEYKSAKYDDKFLAGTSDPTPPSLGEYSFMYAVTNKNTKIAPDTEVEFVSVTFKIKNGVTAASTAIRIKEDTATTAININTGADGQELPLSITQLPAIVITPIPTGTLSIDLTPATGSGWRILGETDWRVSGTAYTVKIPSGDSVVKTVEFKPVDGYFTPANKTYTIKKGANTDTVKYVEKGKIKVTLTPSTGEWRLNTDAAGEYRASGTQAENLAARSYTISYKPIDGYVTPKDETVTVSETAVPGANTHILTRTYAANGTLTVTITPDVISGDARWYLTTDSTKEYLSGKSLSLAPGDYKIGFKNVTGYKTPENMTVSIPAGTPVDKTVEYKKIETGTIKVIISPDVVSADARWYVDGNTEKAYKSGESAVAEVGDHTVSFNKINGYNSPANEKVTVAVGTVKKLTAIYTVKSGGDGGSGGGCNTGLAVFGLLAVVPLVLRRKK